MTTMEELAIRCALGNNGGSWAEHYTEAQKEHWRKFVSDIRRATIEDCATVAEAAIESWSFDSRPTAIEKEVAKAIRALADKEPNNG